MTFPISPSVDFREVDASVVPASALSTSAAFVGKFTWGPVNQIVRVSTVKELEKAFGIPTTSNNVDFLQAVSFLAYSQALDIVRLGKETQSKNASTTGTGFSIINDDDYVVGDLAGVNYIAKYVGELGNSLSVATCDSAARFETALPGSWTFTRSKTVTYTPASGESLVTYFNIGSNLVVDGIPYIVAAVTATTLTLDRLYGGAISAASVVRRWGYADRFAAAPSTGRAHVVVIDTAGRFSGTAGTVLETFDELSTVSTDKRADGSSAYYPNVLAESQYIRVGVLGITGTNSSNKTEIKALSGGVDQFDQIDTDERLLAYDLFLNKQLSSAPLFIGGTTEDQVSSNYLIQNIMEVRKDGVAFFSPNYASVRTASNKASAVKTDRASLPKSSYVHMDNNWKYMYDRYNDTFVWIPCAADSAGIYARVDRERDPWFAAAGAQSGIIKNVVKLAWNASEAERDVIYVADINPIIDMPSTGPVVFGQKTLLGVNSALSRMNVRRLMIFIEGLVTEYAESVLFQFNDELTQGQFKSKVDALLRDVKGRRGIDDFLVVCDSSVNTPTVVQNNQFVAQIFVKPAYAIEFVRLDFVIVNASTSFTEVVGTI